MVGGGQRYGRGKQWPRRVKEPGGCSPSPHDVLSGPQPARLRAAAGTGRPSRTSRLRQGYGATAPARTQPNRTSSDHGQLLILCARARALFFSLRSFSSSFLQLSSLCLRTFRSASAWAVRTAVTYPDLRWHKASDSAIFSSRSARSFQRSEDGPWPSLTSCFSKVFIFFRGSPRREKLYPLSLMHRDHLLSARRTTSAEVVRRPTWLLRT